MMNGDHLGGGHQMRLTAAAYAGWRKAAEDEGMTTAGLLEMIGRQLAAGRSVRIGADPLGDERVDGLRGTPGRLHRGAVAVWTDPPSSIDRSELVFDAIERMAADPAPVNLAILMGPAWPTMFGNLVAALRDRTLAPVEMTVLT